MRYTFKKYSNNQKKKKGKRSRNKQKTGSELVGKNLTISIITLMLVDSTF